MKSFTRGSGPLISVLIPTRNREKHLLQAVDSCYSLAVNPSKNLEFIFKSDDDDITTIEAIRRLDDLLKGSIRIKNVISPQGVGYMQMHEWVNMMAKEALGDWLFLFNDDARIKTQNWDMVIESGDITGCWHGLGDVGLIVAPTIGRPFAQEFIMLRREIFNLLGHFSLNPHNDNWIYSVMKMVDCAFNSPVMIEHFSDTIGDEIRRISEAAYKETAKELNTIPVFREKLKDVNKVLDYIEERMDQEATKKNQEIVTKIEQITPADSHVIEIVL